MTRQPIFETSPTDASSRRDRLVARRSRRTRVAVAAAVTVALAGGAIGVAAYAKSNESSAPALGTNGSHGPKFGRDGTLVPANAVKAPAPRKVDHAHPLKLWIGGDSLAGSFGPALGDQVGATGVV